MKKLLSSEELVHKFNTLTNEERKDALDLALQYMQTENGESSLTCMALLLGYKETDSGFQKMDS